MKSARVLAVAAVLLGVAACTSHPDARNVHVSVTPARALYDTPVTVRVTGLRAADTATLSATSVASDGTTWTDSAVFKADHAGAVTTAQAPTSGSYRGADAMGLFEHEAPGGNPYTPGFFIPKSPWTVTIAVRVAGRQVAAAKVTRLRPAEVGVTSRSFRPAKDGVYGELFMPPHAQAVQRPAVVVFGGSEGALSPTITAEAALLAARGHPALALAYFDEPGLPATLSKIPIEYFATALHRLSSSAGLDGSRAVVWGFSRGSEAALLVAGHYPKLVSGVIASSPSDVAWGATSGTGAAWTWQGRSVPTAPRYEFGRVDPPDAAAAHIDLAAIDGPILAICGKEDGIWPSCGYAASMAARLAAPRSRFHATVLAYPQAGHFVGTVLPYQPATRTSGKTASGETIVAGGDANADEAGRADAWPKLLRFLAELPR